MRALPRYSDEFKTDAVALLIETERPLSQVAADLGVSAWTLRSWYNKAKMAKQRKKPASRVAMQPPAAETPEAKLKRLERECERLVRENESLKMDREILKNAAAFFAKESE